MFFSKESSSSSVKSLNVPRNQFKRNRFRKNQRSTDKRIADKRERMVCRDHHSLNGYLTLRNPPYLLKLHHYIIHSHSIQSYYLRFPIHRTQHNMRPCLKKSTLPHIAVGVFVTDIAHNRCCAGQRNGRRKFQSRKRRRKTKFMARTIIINFKQKLKSLFQRRVWY